MKREANWKTRYGARSTAFLRLVLAAISAACAVPAADINPRFEVATIKPSGPEVRTRRFTIEGRRFLTFNTSLADLIQFAFGLHPRQLAGTPLWVESDKFDVVGQASGNSAPIEQEWMKMMANLVVERFHLRFHMEKRELAVYAISVDRGGPKLEASDGDPDLV